MEKAKGLSIVFDNTMGLTADNVNMPIKKDGAVIGVVTFINDKSVYGLIWDKSISFVESDCSFEIKDSSKHKPTVSYRSNRRKYENSWRFCNK